MKIIVSFYRMRKRLKDHQLLKLKEIIEDEIQRRYKNDEQQKYSN